MFEYPEFKPGWWIRGPHLQTGWARFTRSRQLVTFEREVLRTPDDDDLELDHVSGKPGAPRVLLLHGLEGSAYSHHTQGLAAIIRRKGWNTTALNFRSCARDPREIRRRLRNRRARLYHSGETSDLDFVVRQLAARDPRTALYAIGVSLGGNVLLKWLGETGALGAIRAAVTLSVPYDLAAAARYLERPVGRLYCAHFMRQLKPKAIDLIARFPDETRQIDPARVLASRNFQEFDQCMTAPLHGFVSAEDYYSRSSSIAYLPSIVVPTLCISSDDDPFFPGEELARSRAAASSAVTFVETHRGGHTGFVSGRWPWRPQYWAEEFAARWLGQYERTDNAALR
jgi:predicted alpha/beta-fold hydrolase